MKMFLVIETNGKENSMNGPWLSEEKDLTLPQTNACINFFKEKKKRIVCARKVKQSSTLSFNQ